MYTPRFRNRNAYAKIGKREIQEFTLINGSSCSAPQYGWKTTSGGEVFTCVAVDTIDDIAGDPPQLKAGSSGYKFHPCSRAEATYSSGRNTQWTFTGKLPMCGGSSPPYQSIRNADHSAIWSGLVIPMNGEHIDLERTPYPYAEVSRLRDLAETACLAKRGKFGESNLFESLAEVNKTMGMAKDLVEKARKIQEVLFFGAKGSSRLRSLTNETAGQYLATRYGFMPLVKDLEAILVGLEKPLGRIMQRSIATEEWSSQQTTARPDRIDTNVAIFGESYTVKHKLHVKALSLDSAEVNLLQRLGLGYKELLSVPWELVGYSFVADWFANFGDVISAVIPDIGISHIGACTVVRWECEESVNWTFKGPTASAQNDGTLAGVVAPGPATRQIKYMDRTVGLGAPRLAWRSDFKFSNKTRCLDALALFANAAAKVRPALKPKEVRPLARFKGGNWKDGSGTTRQRGVTSPDRYYG